MIKLAVLDNEVKILDYIYNYINSFDEFSKEIELSKFKCAEEILDKLEQGDKYDIIVSDIELDTLSGIEFGKLVRKKYPDINLIFLTSHPEYAVQSYAIEAYQYILKSEIEERLKPVLFKLINNLKKAKENFIVVKTRFEAHKIYHKDIIYIKKVKGEKYSVFFTLQGKYRERESLDQILKELNNDEFIMVERGYIVNYRHIVCVKGNEIQLSNKECVEISRAKISTVKEQIFNCWEKMQ